jgi:hypothetical protein
MPRTSTGGVMRSKLAFADDYQEGNQFNGGGHA